MAILHSACCTNQLSVHPLHVLYVQPLVSCVLWTQFWFALCFPLHYCVIHGQLAVWLNHVGLLLLPYLNHLQPFSTELTKGLCPVPWKTWAKPIWQRWGSACIISITPLGTSHHRAELFLMKSPLLSACSHSVLTEGLLTAWVMPGIAVSLSGKQWR